MQVHPEPDRVLSLARDEIFDGDTLIPTTGLNAPTVLNLIADEVRVSAEGALEYKVPSNILRCAYCLSDTT